MFSARGESLGKMEDSFLREKTYEIFFMGFIAPWRDETGCDPALCL